MSSQQVCKIFWFLLHERYRDKIVLLYNDFLFGK